MATAATSGKDQSTVRFDCCFCYGQTQAKATKTTVDLLISLNKGIENFGYRFRTDPYSGVGYFNENSVCLSSGRKTHFATRWSKFRCIFEKVPKDLLELSKVAVNFRSFGA